MKTIKWMIILGLLVQSFIVMSQVDHTTYDVYKVKEGDLLFVQHLHVGRPRDGMPRYFSGAGGVVKGFFVLGISSDKTGLVGLRLSADKIKQHVKPILKKDNKIIENIVEISVPPENVETREHRENRYKFHIPIKKLSTGNYSLEFELLNFPDKKIRHCSRVSKLQFIIKDAVTKNEKDEVFLDVLRSIPKNELSNKIPNLLKGKKITGQEFIVGITLSIVYNLPTNTVESSAWLLCSYQYWDLKNFLIFSHLIKTKFGGWKKVLSHSKEIFKRSKEIQKEYFPGTLPKDTWITLEDIREKVKEREKLINDMRLKEKEGKK